MPTFNILVSQVCQEKRAHAVINTFVSETWQQQQTNCFHVEITQLCHVTKFPNLTCSYTFKVGLDDHTSLGILKQNRLHLVCLTTRSKPCPPVV